MIEEPLQTPNLLQGLLWCQVKENGKGDGRQAEYSQGVRTHMGAFLSMSVEKQSVGGNQTWSSQGRVRISNSEF